MARKKTEETPENILSSAAARLGDKSIEAMSRTTGIKRSTMQRRMKNFATFTAGELSTLMYYYPHLSNEEMGKMIREVYG